jgi:CheY-like chemotaxis protein
MEKKIMVLAGDKPLNDMDASPDHREDLAETSDSMSEMGYAMVEVGDPIIAAQAVVALDTSELPADIRARHPSLKECDVYAEAFKALYQIFVSNRRPEGNRVEGVPKDQCEAVRKFTSRLSSEPASAIKTKPKVLVVDDEHVIADTLALILNQSGYDAVPAYDGLAAVDLAQSISPDMVISDVIHPGIDGIEMAIRIREFFPGCRILHISGQTSVISDLLKQAQVRGHEFTVLPKPVRPQHLLAWLKGATDSDVATAVARDAAERAREGLIKASADAPVVPLPQKNPNTTVEPLQSATKADQKIAEMFQAWKEGRLSGHMKQIEHQQAAETAAESIVRLVGQTFSSTNFFELFGDQTLSDGWTLDDALAVWYSLGYLSLIVAVSKTFDSQDHAMLIIDTCQPLLLKQWKMSASILEKFRTVTQETEEPAFHAFTSCETELGLMRFFSSYANRILGAKLPFDGSTADMIAMGFKPKTFDAALPAPICHLFVTTTVAVKELLQKLKSSWESTSRPSSQPASSKPLESCRFDSNRLQVATPATASSALENRSDGWENTVGTPKVAASLLEGRAVVPIIRPYRFGMAFGVLNLLAGAYYGWLAVSSGNVAGILVLGISALLALGTGVGLVRKKRYGIFLLNITFVISAIDVISGWFKPHVGNSLRLVLVNLAFFAAVFAIIVYFNKRQGEFR